MIVKDSCNIGTTPVGFYISTHKELKNHHLGLKRYLPATVFAGSPFSIGLEGSLLHSNHPPS